MAPTPLLQRAIDKAIDHPTYTAGLPPLSEKRWMEILNKSDQASRENDRLEFVGDALMYAALARQMYRQYPDGNPHFYTCLRGALNSNATFSRIAEKMEFYCVSNMVLQGLTRRTFGEGTLAPQKSKGQVKVTADLFETIVAAYYWDAGFEALSRWVGETYHALIKAAADEFDDYRRQHGRFRAKYLPTKPGHAPGRLSFTSPSKGTPSDSTKRCSNQVAAIKHRLRTVEKIKARSSRNPNLKRSVLGSPNVVPKLVPAPAKTYVKALVTANEKQRMQMAPSAPKAVPFIDLTQESDSEGCGGGPSGSQSRAIPLLPRRKVLVSRQPTASARTCARLPHLVLPSAVASSALAVAGGHPGGNRSSSSESEDEVLLETMLTADASDSDMDCSSSDAESPIRASGYSQLLARGVTRVGNGRSDALPRWRSYNKDPFW